MFSFKWDNFNSFPLKGKSLENSEEKEEWL